MSNIVGIDLGTTYSVIASLDENGKPDIHSVDGERITPSFVEFTGKKKYLVGHEPRKAFEAASKAKKKNFAFDAKRHIRTLDGTTWEVFGEKHTPTSVSSLIIKYLKDSFEKANGSIDSAVITIPANFKDEARTATMIAAEKCGLKKLNLIDEPTAAMFSYALSSREKLNGNYVVYDLGGGTFDVSVCSIKGQDIKVLSSTGMDELGGRDFDQKLLEIIQKKFKEETGDELVYDPDGKSDIGMLAIENYKKSLSKRGTIDVSLSIKGKGIADFSVTRKEFEQAISLDIENTKGACEIALEDAKLAIKDIKDIILVGGSTYIPLVRQEVANFFNKEPLSIINPDEAVALGAAIYAGYKADPSLLNKKQKETVSNVSIQEITPHAFGTVVQMPIDESGLNTIPFNSIIIEKGEPRPIEMTREYETMHDNQTELRLTVTEANSNDDTDPEWVTIVWEGTMELPSGREKGRPLSHTFSYDENGMMHCIFKDDESGRTEEIDLEIERKEKDSGMDIDPDEFKVD
tara:strand:- start:3689 stop:5245 length:1557 start_codon:yes stop_codon:yes gene_type:complete